MHLAQELSDSLFACSFEHILLFTLRLCDNKRQTLLNGLCANWALIKLFKSLGQQTLDLRTAIIADTLGLKFCVEDLFA